MILNFQLMTQLMADAINDPNFQRSNTILQDSITTTELLARIAALKPDWPVVLDYNASTPAQITGAVITLDYVNRQFDIPTTAPTGESRIVFNPLLPANTPPLRLKGWLLSSDSTLLTTEMELDFRTPSLSPADPWRKLSQIDLVTMPAGVQFSVLIPTPPLSNRVLKSIHIIAEQM